MNEDIKPEQGSRTPPCLRPLAKAYTLQKIAMAGMPCGVMVAIGACRADEFCRSARVGRPNDYTKAMLRVAVGAVMRR